MAKNRTVKNLTEDLSYIASVLTPGAEEPDPAEVLPLFFDAPSVEEPIDDDDCMCQDDDMLDVDLDAPAETSGPDMVNALCAVMHKAFTVAADNLAIAGYLDQEARIALSGCVGEALKAFTAACYDRMPGACEVMLDGDMQDRMMGESKRRAVTEEDEQAKRVSYHDFDHVMAEVMAGRAMFWVVDQFRRTPIKAKDIKKFAASGYTLLSKDKDGKGFRLQQGKKSVYVFPYQLWKSSPDWH